MKYIFLAAVSLLGAGDERETGAEEAEAGAEAEVEAETDCGS
jgi:hypothetical protein